ncbi:MAG: peptidoglycan/xylan/chitin deacetylase (PgdA/CDA1 family) [Alphaproteobacteria bacterium]|jgi:allantoinase
MTIVHADRALYSPIPTRPKITWPNDARVALWVVPNIEHYEYAPQPQRARNPWPRTPHPDVIGYGSKDYGNRVGVWRMIDVLDKHNVRGTVSLNMANFAHYPEIMRASEERDWSILCHGLYNTRYHWNYSEDEERAAIKECVDLYRDLTGRMLQGWFSPAVSFTLNTPDLVAEAGIKYYCDWYHDDQPLPMRVKSGQLVTVPYSMDLNDSVLHLKQHEGADFDRMIRDTFDTLYAEGAESGRVMCIALHPYIMGQPHRIKHLDSALGYILSHEGVWNTTGEDIADWYLEHCGDHRTAHLTPHQAGGA